MRPRLLLIGPLPPPYGGARVSFQLLVDQLQSWDAGLDVKVIPTWHPERGPWHKMRALVRIMWRILHKARRYDVMVLFASDKGAMFVGPWIHIVSRLYDKSWILRKFGGGFDLTYDSLRFPERFVLKHTLESADLCLLETQYLVREFQERIPEATIDWHANYRPNDTECEERQNCRRFIYIGKVKPTKGIYEILEASDQLSDDITVDVYGPLQDGVSEEIFAPHGNVHYRGLVPPEQVNDTLAQYDALLLPTYYEGEGYPGVILEAYSAGMPVIATRWRAIPEIVDETSGLLVEPGDASDLAQAMSRLVEDESLYRRLCEGACAKRTEFSLAAKAEEFVAHCSDVVTHRRGTRDRHG